MVNIILSQRKSACIFVYTYLLAKLTKYRYRLSVVSKSKSDIETSLKCKIHYRIGCITITCWYRPNWWQYARTGFIKRHPRKKTRKKL